MKKELQDALELLYKTCYPLIWDDIKTKEEIKDLYNKITTVTYYCDYVEERVKNGYSVMSFEDWDYNNKNYTWERLINDSYK